MLITLPSLELQDRTLIVPQNDDDDGQWSAISDLEGMRRKKGYRNSTLSSVAELSAVTYDYDDKKKKKGGGAAGVGGVFGRLLGATSSSSSSSSKKKSNMDQDESRQDMSAATTADDTREESGRDANVKDTLPTTATTTTASSTKQQQESSLPKNKPPTVRLTVVKTKKAKNGARRSSSSSSLSSLVLLWKKSSSNKKENKKKITVTAAGYDITHQDEDDVLDTSNNNNNNIINNNNRRRLPVKILTEDETTASNVPYKAEPVKYFEEVDDDDDDDDDEEEEEEDDDDERAANERTTPRNAPISAPQKPSNKKNAPIAAAQKPTTQSAKDHAADSTDQHSKVVLPPPSIVQRHTSVNQTTLEATMAVAKKNSKSQQEEPSILEPSSSWSCLGMICELVMGEKVECKHCRQLVYKEAACAIPQCYYSSSKLRKQYIHEECLGELANQEMLMGKVLDEFEALCESLRQSNKRKKMFLTMKQQQGTENNTNKESIFGKNLFSLRGFLQDHKIRKAAYVNSKKGTIKPKSYPSSSSSSSRKPRRGAAAVRKLR